MTNPEQSKDQSPLPIESSDDAILRMFGGASFSPDSKLILPSGKELRGDEAQAFTSAFSDHEQDVDPNEVSTGHTMDSGIHPKSPEIANGDNPLDSRFDDWTGDPSIDRVRLIARAREAAQSSSEVSRVKHSQSGVMNSQSQKTEKINKKRWWKRNR